VRHWAGPERCTTSETLRGRTLQTNHSVPQPTLTTHLAPLCLHESPSRTSPPCTAQHSHIRTKSCKMSFVFRGLTSSYTRYHLFAMSTSTVAPSLKIQAQALIPNEHRIPYSLARRLYKQTIEMVKTPVSPIQKSEARCPSRVLRYDREMTKTAGPNQLRDPRFPSLLNLEDIKCEATKTSQWEYKRSGSLALGI